MSHNLRKLGLSALTAIAMIMLCVPAHAQRMYKWTDENGVVHYGPSIPPEYKDQAHQRLNSQGVVVGETERAKTEEELRVEMEEAQARAAEQAAYEEKIRTQRLLLSTYADESDITKTRDQRMEVIERAADASRAYIAGRTRNLSRLMDRAAQLESRGHTVSAALRSSIDEIRRQIAEQEAFIAKKEAELKEISDYYDVELERYREAKAERDQARAAMRSSS